MTGSTSGRFTGQIHLVAESSRVTRLELVLDLIFVFALLSVTSVVAGDLTLLGLLRGLLLLGLLWWCWSSYVWLGNVVRIDRGFMPLILVGLIAVLLVLVMTLPKAFVDVPGGLHGPTVFVVSYLVARAGALVMQTIGVWSDRSLRPRLTWYWVPLLMAGALLLAAAHRTSRDGTGGWIPLLLVLAALVVEYGSGLVIGVRKWRIGSVRHWVDRHSLFVMIALGETIISIGAGWAAGPGDPITWSAIAGALFSVLVVGALWWVYFNLPKNAAAHRLAATPERDRARLARDAYTFLHLPMVAGLILLALGLRTAIHALAAPGVVVWDGLPRLALFGGVVLFLLGLLAFEARAMGIFGRGAALGTALTALALPLTATAPLLVELGVLAVTAASPVLADYTVFRRRHVALHRAVRPAAGGDEGVSSKELFFDLVVTATMLQVVVVTASQPSWANLLRGLAVLALLWWAWCCFAWLASVVRTEAAAARAVTIMAVFATLVVSLSLPGLFRPEPAGLPAPLVLATCYAVLRVLHIAS
ncbi:MAG TPA: low temperature requirement protein A, partial [Micromonospora sp.]